MIKKSTFEIGRIMILPGFKEVLNPVHDTIPPDLEACPLYSYVVRGAFPNGRPWLIRIDGDKQYTVAGISFS